MITRYIEPTLHLLFWVFMLSALNVQWTEPWFDPSIRPNKPAPLSVVMFATFFYLHTFILLPKYFAVKTWKKYVLYAFLLFILPELVRIIIYQFTVTDTSFMRTLFGRDSFLFGAPSPLFIAINASFIYRFTKDRFLKKGQNESNKGRSSVPYEDTILLNDEQAHDLKQRLYHQLESESIFLDPELTLRDLAEAVDSTEKKVSYLLNQYLDTSFYELINQFRVEKFKTEVLKPENANLSMVGVASNCGFPSKSSFYRAFKSQVSMSPSEYVKKLTKDQ